ncbi:TetR/AcrR family transcriptional regulator [Pseudonocardia zijingensis]|uniref:TetR/AcrR family transcriptional regulator n=1 Tax=Pseudonocardia zijingensis TaxID=153376 RepID=A0ABN1NB66_9PSEU
MAAPAGRRAARAAETEAALKEAARRVFAERGYLNTKITDITSAAGRAAGSFYNHFAGKDELLTALLTDMLEDNSARTDPEHDPDLSRRGAVRWHVAEFWHFYRRHLPEMVALREAATVSPEFGRRLQEIISADSAHLLGHLELVRAAGIPLPGDPRLLVSAVHCLLDQFAHTWLVLGGDGSRPPVDDDEAIDLLTDLLHRGLAGTPPEGFGTAT